MNTGMVDGQVAMEDKDQVLARMDDLLQAWEAAKDRRLIFLSCYRMMTQNIIAATAAGEFEDPAWVTSLMEHFAGYYFTAVDEYETDPKRPPTAWQIAFSTSNNPKAHVLQHLVLGVNAHINYDLVLALTGILSPEWENLTEEQRQMRYRDHCRVNDVIYKTIDPVQNQIIDRYEPIWGVVGTLLGPIDEWMTELMISDWREEVWKHAMQMVEEAPQHDRQNEMQRVERIVIDRARDILGKGNLEDLIEFI